MAIEFRVCNPESQFTLANTYIHQMKRQRKRERKGNIPKHPTADYSFFIDAD